jgi:GGDEF domain-containing protein
MRVADLLQAFMPPPALIGRVGKCRFASILAGVTTEETESVAARTAHRLEELIADVPGAGIQLPVTHFRDADRLEALLAEGSPADSRPLAKPVMLAD